METRDKDKEHVTEPADNEDAAKLLQKVEADITSLFHPVVSPLMLQRCHLRTSSSRSSAPLDRLSRNRSARVSGTLCHDASHTRPPAHRQQQPNRLLL